MIDTKVCLVNESVFTQVLRSVVRIFISMDFLTKLGCELCDRKVFRVMNENLALSDLLLLLVFDVLKLLCDGITRFVHLVFPLLRVKLILG